MRLKGGSFLSNIKNALFPVEGWEMPKFFSMSAMMFMIIYIYTTVRDTKDTLVVSACGAESITFLKVYGVLPAATMFMVLYSKLSSIFSKDQVCFCRQFLGTWVFGSRSFPIRFSNSLEGACSSFTSQLLPSSSSTEFSPLSSTQIAT